jgi:hypothetical protein
VTLKTDRSDGKVFRVHKLVLAANGGTKFCGFLDDEDACLVLAGVDDDTVEKVGFCVSSRF